LFHCHISTTNITHNEAGSNRGLHCYEDESEPKLTYVIHKDFVRKPTSQSKVREVRTGKSSLLTGTIVRNA